MCVPKRHRWSCYQTFSSAQRVKEAIEKGGAGEGLDEGLGLDGPCFNPNEDNVNFQDNEQAGRDDRWLLVWQHMARQAKASGGKIVQIVDRAADLSKMQQAEADFAEDLELAVIRREF